MPLAPRVLATVVAPALAAVMVPLLVAPAVASPAEPVPPQVSAGTDGAAEVGTWSVEPAGDGVWEVSWRAPQRLPVTSDRPTVTAEPGATAAPVEVGVATVAPDGRTVTVPVVSPQAPAAAALDVVLSGQSLDDPADSAEAPTAPARWTEPPRTLLDVDPATPGDLPVMESDYVLDPITVPGMPEPVEMSGHVVEPDGAAASADHPLVLFLHGRHAWCYNPARDRITWDWPCRGAQEPVPSQLGYHYVQRTLASQGYVTVSVAANGINAQDGALQDAGASGRSQLVQAHLDQWAEWAGTKHQVDLDRVVLVGHSRGGEGVARAALEIPLDAPYRVAGQVLLAPTDFSRQTTPFVPTVTVLPSCDGDVSDLQGQAYTDVSRGLVTGDTSVKSSVMVVGANHNFFNTEWTPATADAPADDDWYSSGGACGRGKPTRLTAAEQRRVGRAYIAGAVRWFTGAGDEFAPMYDGSPVRVASTGDAVVLSHALGGGRDLRRPGREAGPSIPAGADTRLCRGVTPWESDGDGCGRFAGSPEHTPHWPGTEPEVPSYPAFEMRWTASGQRGGLTFDAPLDLTDARALALRTVVDPLLGDVRLAVRLTDADGTTVQLTPAAGPLLPALPRGPRWYAGKHWAQELRVGAEQLSGADPALDISQLVAVELVGQSDRGRVWVLDVAGVPEVSPAVPVRRVPLVDLGAVRVDEGDSPGVAEVPFTVTGDVVDPGSFTVQATDWDTGTTQRTDVTVAPGSTGGVVRWEHPGDTFDSPRRVVHLLEAYATSNLMLRDHFGRVVVLDDDPDVTLRLRRERRTVPEGGVAAWRLELSAPAGYGSYAQLRVVAGSSRGTQLRADDVPRRWLRRHALVRPGWNPPLHRADVTLFKRLRPGQLSVRFTIPIRNDRVREGRETVTAVVRSELSRKATDPVAVSVRRGR
jgi:dienelactone hydrolase